MEYLIGIGVILGGMFVYGYMQASKWEKQYKIAIGKYYKLTPQQAQSQSRFEGTCYFDEMASPINVGLRLSKGEKIYACFDNLSLMAYKRDGTIGGYGITLRKKVLPGTYLRGGLGKFGMSKSWQSDASGTLYVTNKGVFFDGDQKNFKLPWEKIMREQIDSNSIQLEKSNGSPILLQGVIDPNEAAIFTLTGQLYESL